MEALVEGTFARLFAGHIHPRDVAVQLARALEDSAREGFAATRYAVRLHPADAQTLLGAQPRLAEALSNELVALAREAHFTLAHKPEVLILPDATMKPRSVQVNAESRSPFDTTTHGMTPATSAASPAQGAPRAFLILNGERTTPLTQPVVSIGRRLDNHIILDDSRVSRAHAQLRLRFGRYVIYDLGSSGGTFVNGQRVDECVLRPGDVISLGGVPIIYGEDDDDADPTPVRRHFGQTQPNPAQPTEPPENTSDS